MSEIAFKMWQNGIILDVKFKSISQKSSKINTLDLLGFLWRGWEILNGMECEYCIISN